MMDKLEYFQDFSAALLKLAVQKIYPFELILPLGFAHQYILVLSKKTGLADPGCKLGTITGKKANKFRNLLVFVTYLC